MSTNESSVKTPVENLREVKRCRSCGAPFIQVPTVLCAHCSSVILPRCFYYRSGKTWIAECVDFDLVSEGSLVDDAIGRLQEAIYGYVDLVTDGGAAPARMRPAPFSHWLHYYVQSAVRRFVSLMRRRRGCGSRFTVSGPMIEGRHFV